LPYLDYAEDKSFSWAHNLFRGSGSRRSRSWILNEYGINQYESCSRRTRTNARQIPDNGLAHDFQSRNSGVWATTADLFNSHTMVLPMVYRGICCISPYLFLSLYIILFLSKSPSSFTYSLRCRGHQIRRQLTAKLNQHRAAWFCGYLNIEVEGSLQSALVDPALSSVEFE
jgi:hypothetical protein